MPAPSSHLQSRPAALATLVRALRCGGAIYLSGAPTVNDRSSPQSRFCNHPQHKWERQILASLTAASHPFHLHRSRRGLRTSGRARPGTLATTEMISTSAATGDGKTEFNPKRGNLSPFCSWRMFDRALRCQPDVGYSGERCLVFSVMPCRCCLRCPPNRCHNSICGIRRPAETWQRHSKIMATSWKGHGCDVTCCCHVATITHGAAMSLPCCKRRVNKRGTRLWY